MKAYFIGLVIMGGYYTAAIPNKRKGKTVATTQPTPNP